MDEWDRKLAVIISQYKFDLSEQEKSIIRLRTCFAGMISSASAGFDYAVTLTYTDHCRPRTREDAERYANRFSERYNIAFGYGPNANWKKKHDLTKAAPMFMLNDCTYDHRGNEVNFHHHLALVKPPGMSDTAFQLKVALCWQQCLEGHQPAITEVEPIESGGWSKYLAKKMHIGNQEAYDVEASNIY
jgi:hypothetical protein